MVQATRRGQIFSAAVGSLIFCVLGFAALSSPWLPYNVRELAPEGARRALAVPVLVFVLYWTFGVPAVLAVWLTGGTWRRALLYFPAVLAHGLIAWIALRIAVPLEPIHDIVGSPILTWPRELEMTARFLGLFLAPSVLLTGAAVFWILVQRPPMMRPGGALLRWAAAGIPLLLASYGVVVAMAATDNLTELMAGGGTWAAAIALAAWWLFLAIGGSGLSRLAAGSARSWGWALLLVLLTWPLGYAAITWGTEASITKYGQRFSALQFLLSPDRKHYVAADALLVRYFLAYTAAILILAVTQFPVWLGRRRSGEGGAVSKGSARAIS